MTKPKKATAKTKPQSKILKDSETEKVKGGSFSWGASNLNNTHKI